MVARAAARTVSDVTLEVRPLGPALGAEIGGIDLSQPVDDETIAEIRALWAEHQVLLFPEQRLSEEAQVAFSSRFGELAVFHEREKRSSSRPEILRIGNVDEDGNRIDPNHPTRRYFAILTALWHSDGSYKAIPSLGSALHALEVPPEGGETWFTNLFAAYVSGGAKIHH
ncbi:MAG: TauD/TfdA family dioxygenase [Alphaproteobacteria bacterium]|jgi:taurine dioxygenase|nr:TauD/TfdA family dioxygenase [Alphaproteobacteria bacterium]